MINIVGLGPGDYKYLTLEARDLIENSKRIFARTSQHACIKPLQDLGFEIAFFDSFYETSETFEDVYSKIVNRLLNESENGDLTYLVPGSPLVFEKTVTMLIDRLEEADYRLVHGVSFLDILFTKLSVDPLLGFSVVDALNLECEPKERRGAIAVTQCYDRFLASETKLWLGDIVGDEAEVIVCQSLGNSNSEKIIRLPLYQLDWEEEYFNHETTIFSDVDKWRPSS